MRHHVGSATVEKIFEADLNGLTFRQLLPDLDEDHLRAHPEWLPVGTYDDQGHAFMSLHAWLVRYQGRTILIDTGAGNDKPRPQQLVLDRLQTRFLDRLADAGIVPADIDLVLHTHIHSDHVGWDTQLVDGEWMPTFPNAELIVSELEFTYGRALARGDDAGASAARARAGLGEPVRIPVSGTFDDSIAPLERAGRLRKIAVDGSDIVPGIRFVPTPGHSIDHASIELTSDGETAIFSGDVFHHPVEIYDADLVSMFCEFPAATRQSRRWLLDHAADRNALVFSSHFPGTSVGFIIRDRSSYRWQPWVQDQLM